MGGMRKDTRETFLDLTGRLKAVRLSQGRSLKAVADDIGVYGTMVARWEDGRSLPSGAYFIAWVESLGFFVDITDGAEEEK